MHKKYHEQPNFKAIPGTPGRVPELTVSDLWVNETSGSMQLAKWRLHVTQHCCPYFEGSSKWDYSLVEKSESGNSWGGGNPILFGNVKSLNWLSLHSLLRRLTGESNPTSGKVDCCVPVKWLLWINWLEKAWLINANFFLLSYFLQKIVLRFSLFN